MANLDDLKLTERLDTQRMGSFIAEFPEQIDAAWQAFKGISIPTHYVQAHNILILGMGGSAIGGELAATLANQTSSVPIEVRRDYGIPAYVSKDSLVIGVSYSGNTEETLDGFLQAASRGAKLIAVTSGGELGSLARKFQIPLFPIDYGSQPRAAMGYLLTAVITILGKLRHYPLQDRELEETAILMRALITKIGPEVATPDNQAKILAGKLKDRIPLVIGSGLMTTVARRWKTQFNENGKLAAVAEAMPELCHNVVVGMERVYKQRETLYPIFLDSAFYHPRNQLRMQIVSKQFAASKLPVEHIGAPTTGTPLSEALQIVLFGDYLSYYVALQANADPTEINPIISLKKELDAQPWEKGSRSHN